MGEKPSYEGKLQYSSFSPWENGYYIARFRGRDAFGGIAIHHRTQLLAENTSEDYLNN